MTVIKVIVSQAYNRFLVTTTLVVKIIRDFHKNFVIFFQGVEWTVTKNQLKLSHLREKDRMSNRHDETTEMRNIQNRFFFLVCSVFVFFF